MEYQAYLDELQRIVVLYGFQIIYALLILIIGLWIAKKVSRITEKVLLKRNVDPTLTKFAIGLIRGILIVFVVIAAISQTGVETTSLVAVLGAAGLAIGLALQGSLANFAAGVMLIIFRPIKVGQFIEAAGTKGIVDTVGIFVTILTTPDNKVIYVPNSNLFGSTITNYSEKELRRVDMVFGISYDDDIDKAKAILTDILEKNDKVLKDPAWKIALNELADSSVNFIVRPWVKSEHYWDVYWGTQETVKKRFDAEDISIPYPQRDVHLFNEK